jgi:hypothetical protein
MSAAVRQPAFEAARRGPRWAEMDGDTRRAVVSTLLAEGHSASQIGDAVEASRNAILGFSHRNGLAGDGYGHRLPKNDRSAAGGHATRKKAGVTLAGRAGPCGPAAVGSGQSAVGGDEGGADLEILPPTPEEGDPLADAGAATPLPTADCPLPPSGPIGFLALTNERCKRPLWPNGPVPKMDEQFYCGAPAVDGSSWCRACAGRLLAGAPQPAGERRRAA